MVARIEVKLGTHGYHIISMTTTWFHDDNISFEQQPRASDTILHSSNLLTVARMKIKLGMNAYYKTP